MEHRNASVQQQCFSSDHSRHFGTRVAWLSRLIRYDHALTPGPRLSYMLLACNYLPPVSHATFPQHRSQTLSFLCMTTYSQLSTATVLIVSFFIRQPITTYMLQCPYVYSKRWNTLGDIPARFTYQPHLVQRPQCSI